MRVEKPKVDWGSPKGICRLCLKAILNRKGEQDMRRNWHPECWEKYDFFTSNGTVRREVFKRDKGLCRACGLDTVKFMANLTPDSKAALSVLPRVTFWDADHVVRLADGGSHDMANLQTLCVTCHRSKCGDETRKEVRA